MKYRQREIEIERDRKDMSPSPVGMLPKLGPDCTPCYHLAIQKKQSVWFHQTVICKKKTVSCFTQKVGLDPSTLHYCE